MRLDATHKLGKMVPANLKPALRKLLFERGASLKMSSDDRQFLIDYYRTDVLKLGSLLQRDLGAWLEV